MNTETITIKDKTFELLIESKEIKKAIGQMAEAINRDYEGKEVVVIGVLDGVFMVLAALVKKLNLSVSIELIKLKSYEGMSSTGQIRKIFGLTTDLKDKHVLIVEDIIDTGTTLAFLLNLIRTHQPATLRTATLLLKEEAFQNQCPIEYVGLRIPNRFVVGYGMDYDGQGRQLPHIYALRT